MPTKPKYHQITTYFPFGMVMSEWSGSEGSAEYRYGFDGQEQDNELYREGNSYTIEFDKNYS